VTARLQSRAQRRLIDGPVGRIEVALDAPIGSPAGLAFIGHPHPLYGGTLENKVTATLARAFSSLGWLAVRPNFRGVGASEGEHDHGNGETDDFVFLIDSAPQWLAVDGAAALPRALAGFSFGSFVAAQACARLSPPPAHLILVGAAAGKWPLPPVAADTLVIHGEFDETIPLAHVFEWARPQELPIVVMPGADHFFHRRLSTLKRLVREHLVARHSRETALDSRH
jgi:alpha/beta superfamily hydrolase